MVENQCEEPKSSQPTVAGNALIGQKPVGEQFDAACVPKVRAEAVDDRKRLRNPDAAAKAAEDVKLSGAERASKRLAGLEREQTTWQRERQDLTTNHGIEWVACVAP